MGDLSRDSEMLNLQDDMFGEPQPVISGAPNWLQTSVSRVYQLHQKYGKLVLDNDQLLIYRYWQAFDGLDEVWKSDCKNEAFQKWFLQRKITSAETICRARRWLVENFPDMASNYVTESRKKREGLVRRQM